MCPDIAKEFRKYETDVEKWVRRYTGTHNVTKKEFSIDVGHERFMAPEIFFHPVRLFSERLRVPCLAHFRLGLMAVLKAKYSFRNLQIQNSLHQ